MKYECLERMSSQAKAGIMLTFNLHCKAIAALFFVPYCCLISMWELHGNPEFKLPLHEPSINQIFILHYLSLQMGGENVNIRKGVLCKSHN